MSQDIQSRLLNFAETPPASAWQGIADALDNTALAQKLYNYEVAPPAANWEQLQAQLNPPATKVVPLRKPLFQYAIAAAVALALALGSIFYFTNHTATPVAQQTPGNTSGQPANTLLNTPPNSTPETTIRDQEDEIQATASEYENEALTARAMVHFSPRVRILKNELTADQITVLPEEKTNIDTTLQSRYMIATTASGNVVRLPKKAYSDYVCADRVQNYPCKEKLAAIQSKLAASVATDFTDFMDLLKKLQDNP